MTDRAQRVMDALLKYTEHPEYVNEWMLSNALRETINQLQQNPGVIMCADVLELCDELEALK
jgi:hypothetical protein